MRPIESYFPFLEETDVYAHPGFNKITLVENDENILPKLANAYKNEKPFVYIKIPSTEEKWVFMAVSLGLAVVVFISLGIAPNVEDRIS